MSLIASNTKTNLVNAAFLQEVKDSNLQLWSILHELREIRHEGDEPRDASRKLVDKLSELRDCIGLEFSLEETYGFMEGNPRLRSMGTANADDAKMQHRELYLQLHELCEQAEEAQ